MALLSSLLLETGDSSTIIPFKEGGYSSDGRAKASLIQKIQTKVLSLGDSSGAIYSYVGVTQSKEKLRDTLGTISSVLKYIGGAIPLSREPCYRLASAMEWRGRRFAQSTLEKYWKWFRSDGFEGLLPNDRSDAGKSRVLSPEFLKILDQQRRRQENHDPVHCHH